MGCSNTKSFPQGANIDNAPLTDAMNALNAIDPSEVVEEGQKLINQGQQMITQIIDEGDKMISQANEALEKSAAALESAIGKNPFDTASEKFDDVSKELMEISETAEDNVKDEINAEFSADETENVSDQEANPVENSMTASSPNEAVDTEAATEDESLKNEDESLKNEDESLKNEDESIKNEDESIKNEDECDDVKESDQTSMEENNENCTEECQLVETVQPQHETGDGCESSTENNAELTELEENNQETNENEEINEDEAKTIEESNSQESKEEEETSENDDTNINDESKVIDSMDAHSLATEESQNTVNDKNK